MTSSVPMMTISRILAVLLIIGTEVAAQAILPPGAPELAPITDAEIIAALQGDDEGAKYAAIGKADYTVAPGSLRPETVAAIALEFKKALRASESRYEAFLAGTGEQPTEGSHGDYIAELASLLIENVSPPHADGIDALAEVVHLGRPMLTLVELGNAAVPSLVRVARINPRRFDSGRMQDAMEALGRMLESAKIRPTLTPNSHAVIRQLAADRMRTLRGDDNARNLAAAAYLAVATGDRQLRTEAAALVDNDSEFFRRDISVQVGQEVSDSVRQALEKFPQ